MKALLGFVLAVLLFVATVFFARHVATTGIANAPAPKALGWERGQSVPESAIVKKGPFLNRTFKTDYAQPVAGLDEVLVSYTAKQGVCGVTGFHNFTSKDGYGAAHLSMADEWADRIAAKFGGVAGNKAQNYGTVSDEPQDLLRALNRGDAFYFYRWGRRNLPEGYSAVEVVARPSYIKLQFKFDNWSACDAEREAARQAEL